MACRIGRYIYGLSLACTGLVASAEPHWERVRLPDNFVLRSAMQPDINGDGRFLAFVSTYDRATPAVTIYLYDRESGELTTPLLDHVAEASEPALSANGRYLAYTTIDRQSRLRLNSTRIGLFANRLDVHRFDLIEGRLDTLSRLNTGRAPEYRPRLTADGEFLLYLRSSRFYYSPEYSVFGSGETATALDPEGWLYNTRTEQRTALGFAWGTAISDNGRYISRCDSNCANSSQIPEQWLFDRETQQVVDAQELRIIDLNEDASALLYMDNSGERPMLVYADLWDEITVPLPDDAPAPDIASARISADGEFLVYELAEGCSPPVENRVFLSVREACGGGLALFRRVE